MRYPAAAASHSAMHDRWFGNVQNHTVLRYVRGWERIDPDE